MLQKVVDQGYLSTVDLPRLAKISPVMARAVVAPPATDERGYVKEVLKPLLSNLIALAAEPLQQRLRDARPSFAELPP